MGRLTGCRGSSLPTLPDPVTAVWAWGGGTAGGAVTTVAADLKFTVGVVVAMHHTHTPMHTHSIYTPHTHRHTPHLCLRHPKDAQQCLWNGLTLTINCTCLRYFQKRVSYIDNELNECSLFLLVFPRNKKAAPASHEDEEIFMTGQFQKTLAELDEDLEGKHRPSCLDVSARARHPEGIRAAEGTAGNHVGKMCAEETCCERGGPGLGAKHAGSSAPRGAVHLGGRTVPRRCPSRCIRPALRDTDSAHQKSAHINQKRRSQPSDELGKHWVPLWQTGLCIKVPTP